MKSKLYSSVVVHQRFVPFKNKFKYNTLSMLIEYDELISLSKFSKVIYHLEKYRDPKNENGIPFNDKELKNYDSLYSIASYLPQDPVVLDSSIEKNISFQKETSLINKKRIEESLKFAELYNFVNSLPNKTNTLIGESGINLSGGQKQRLLLARNFYFNREIIILDEATSALDLETQKNITRNIELLKNNKTLIIITHKIETLKNCHKVFKIENKKLKLYDQYK